jgi:hypothetical protein
METQIDFWKMSNLSYSALKYMSLLGGFFGIDHIYLRSPLTGFLKLIVNIFTFAIFFIPLWYIYDLTQIFMDETKVKLFGLSKPFSFSNYGLGAGMFEDEYPSKIGNKDIDRDRESSKSWTFVGYALLTLTIVPAMFGANDFMVGMPNNNGKLKALLTISILGAGISALLSAFEAIRVIFSTRTVIDNYSEQFGYYGTGLEADGTHTTAPDYWGMLQSFIAWCKGIFDWFKEKFWKFTTALFPWMILPQIEQALVTMDAKDIEAKVDEYTDKLGDKVLRFADKLSPITDKLAPILQRKVDVHLDIDTGKEKNTQSAAESVIQSAANVNKSANNNKQSTEPIVNTQAESASNANLSVNTASQSVANSKNSVAEPAKPTTLPVTKSAANTTNQPAESAANTAKTAAEAIKGGAQTILNTAAFATAATATTTQTSPLLTYLTVGTIILVIVSGIYVFSSRIKQAHHDNEKPGSKGKNDTPPEPTDV